MALACMDSPCWSDCLTSSAHAQDFSLEWQLQRGSLMTKRYCAACAVRACVQVEEQVAVRMKKLQGLLMERVDEMEVGGVPCCMETAGVLQPCSGEGTAAPRLP